MRTKLCHRRTLCSRSSGFIATVHQCIASCENCVKAATALLAEFHFEGHEEHKETIDHCVKALGEAITICNASIEICGDLSKCRVACREALDACDRALEACDECFESYVKSTRCFNEQPKKELITYYRRELQGVYRAHLQAAVCSELRTDFCD